MEDKKSNEMDFLGENDFLESSNDSIKSEDVSSKAEDKTENPSMDNEVDLLGEDYPEQYISMVKRILFQYKLLPKIEYDSIYKEISDLSIKSCPTPTLQVLNDELQKVQAAKDRLSEILIDVIRCYNFKKRAVDILKDAWGKFTSEKNTEGRKGDATFRLGNFLIDFAEIEALSKACDHVFKNLDGLHDNLSRRITIWQLILKVNDPSRTSLPDYDYNRGEKAAKEIFSDKEAELFDGEKSSGQPTLEKF